MDPVAEAPVASSATPDAPTQSAVQAAVTGSASDYRAAKRAELAGKPLAPVPVSAETPDAVPDTRKTRQEKDQARINDSIRTATTAATAALTAELAALKAQLQTRPTEAPKPAETPPAAPAWKRLAALPDAPKLKDFESVEEHTAAMAVFVAEQLAKDGNTRTEQQTTEARDRASREMVDRFVDRLTEAKTADPQFLAKLSDPVKAMKPFIGLNAGEVGGPSHMVAELTFRSPLSNDLLVKLSEANSAAFTRLTTMPAHLAKWYPVKPIVAPSGQTIDSNRAARVQAHADWIGEEFLRLERSLMTAPAPAAASRPPKTLTDAPAARADLGSRTTEVVDQKVSAVKRGDTSAYRQLRREERLAERGR